MAELKAWRGRLIDEVRELQEQEVIHDVTDEPAVQMLYLPYQGFNDRDIRREVARLHKSPTSGFGRLASDANADHFGHRTSNIEHRTIRIGFLSSFFRRHRIGLLMGGLVKQLSRKDFEVIVLSSRAARRRCRGLFQAICGSLCGCALAFTGGPPAHCRPTVECTLLPGHRHGSGDLDAGSVAAALVQCTTWGHPVTTGIDTIDYFISGEARETEEADQHYTETLVRLKSFPILSYQPEFLPPLLPSLTDGRARKKLREDFGLAGDAHVYACPQSLYKLHPEFDAVLEESCAAIRKALCC